MIAPLEVRHIDAAFMLLDTALPAPEPSFKRPGGNYTDPRIPVGHAHVIYFPVPYSDETEDYRGRVLSEGALFIRIEVGSDMSVTVPKRDSIITRGTGPAIHSN